jgi:excisionase family DNA binding protein
MSQYSSLKKAADSYGISQRFLYKLFYQGEIQMYKLGNRTLVDIDEIDAKIKGQSLAVEAK